MKSLALSIGSKQAPEPPCWTCLQSQKEQALSGGCCQDRGAPTGCCSRLLPVLPLQNLDPLSNSACPRLASCPDADDNANGSCCCPSSCSSVDAMAAPVAEAATAPGCCGCVCLSLEVRPPNLDPLSSSACPRLATSPDANDTALASCCCCPSSGSSVDAMVSPAAVTATAPDFLSPEFLPPRNLDPLLNSACPRDTNGNDGSSLTVAPLASS